MFYIATESTCTLLLYFISLKTCFNETQFDQPYQCTHDIFLHGYTFVTVVSGNTADKHISILLTISKDMMKILLPGIMPIYGVTFSRGH